jgi:hypothetical protein
MLAGDRQAHRRRPPGTAQQEGCPQVVAQSDVAGTYVACRAPEGEHRRCAATGHGGDERIVGVEHRCAVGRQGLDQLALGRRHAGQVAEQLQMRSGDDGDDAHLRVGQLAQRCDVAWAPGAHLHHQRFDIVGRIAQGQRDADLVVERPLARRGDQVRSQHPRHQILHGRLTHRTGDADDAGRHAVPGEAGQVVQRRPGVGHQQQAGVVVEPQIVGAALRQRRRRPSGQSGGDEVVTVALGDQRHEQVAGPGQAGIGDDPVDRGIGADQGGAKRTGQRSEGYLHALSLPRSTVPTSVLNRHSTGRSQQPACPAGRRRLPASEARLRSLGARRAVQHQHGEPLLSTDDRPARSVTWPIQWHTKVRRPPAKHTRSVAPTARRRGRDVSTFPSGCAWWCSLAASPPNTTSPG